MRLPGVLPRGDRPPHGARRRARRTVAGARRGRCRGDLAGLPAARRPAAVGVPVHARGRSDAVVAGPLPERRSARRCAPRPARHARPAGGGHVQRPPGGRGDDRGHRRHPARRAARPVAHGRPPFGGHAVRRVRRGCRRLPAAVAERPRPELSRCRPAPDVAQAAGTVQRGLRHTARLRPPRRLRPGDGRRVRRRRDRAAARRGTGRRHRPRRLRRRLDGHRRDDPGRRRSLPAGDHPVRHLLRRPGDRRPALAAAPGAVDRHRRRRRARGAARHRPARADAAHRPGQRSRGAGRSARPRRPPQRSTRCAPTPTRATWSRSSRPGP